jgi:hypothetical protein
MLSDSREVWVTAIQAIRLSQLNLAARPEAIPWGYVAEVKEPAFCRMVLISDAINKNGRTKMKVEWTLSARRIDDETTEYTNHIHTSATDEFITFVQEHGITLEQAAAARLERLIAMRNRCMGIFVHSACSPNLPHPTSIIASGILRLATRRTVASYRNM